MLQIIKQYCSIQWEEKIRLGLIIVIFWSEKSRIYMGINFGLIYGQCAFRLFYLLMDELIFIWKQKQARLSQLPLKQIEFSKQQQSGSIENLQKTVKAKQEKSKQCEQMDNYFDINDLASFAQTLKTIENILRIQDTKKAQTFHTQFSQVYNTPLKDIKSLIPTKKSKIQICFSRNERQPQHTIYVFLTRFHTTDEQTKIRVLILNQRGYILQVLSNINPKNCYDAIGKKIKSFYTRIENIVVLSQKENCCDFDAILALKSVVGKGNGKEEEEKDVNIILIGINQNFGKVQFRKQSLGRIQNYYLQEDKIYLVLMMQSKLIVSSSSQFSLANLISSLKLMSETIQLLAKMRQLFNHYPEDSQSFNQKQFFLQLFCFSFNFSKNFQLKDLNLDQLKLQILLLGIEQIAHKKAQISQKNLNIQQHCYYTNKTVLSCLVCEKKSRVTCLKCCEQYKGDFALCKKSPCFQQFHQNPLNFIDRIKPRKASKAQKRRIYEPMNRSDQSNEYSDQLVNTNQTRQKSSIQDLRRKWGSYIEQNEKQTMDSFFRKAVMNFVPRKIMDRIHLFSLRINQLSYKLMPQQINVKQQE